MQVITRFAPSPTGMLHIGGARTALFNYLFAKHTNGKFLLRIEDTDKKRSTEEAKQVIIDGLKWLGIDYDDEIIYQAAKEERHREVAQELLKTGKAYYCYASKEELDEMREVAQRENKRFKYDRRWRDRDPSEAPKDIKPVIRIKAPIDGNISFIDSVQGSITIDNKEQDDFIIVRSDGTPTYMLAVVVDDYDMGVTHVIRGDDHLTNCSKQIIIYDALNWQKPNFSHIPLIYGPDGKKMSKRHGATAVTDYKELGYLPEAMRNYLLRLGFSHGDDEIISDDQAIKWFDLENLGKSPARFDFKKLDNLNAHYLREKSNDDLVALVKKQLNFQSEAEISHLIKLMPELKIRITNLGDLYFGAKFIKDDFDVKSNMTDKAKKSVATIENLQEIIDFIEDQDDLAHQNLYEKTKLFSETKDIKLKNIAAFLRAAITGSHMSPSIFEIIEIFGPEKTLKRLKLFV